MNRVIVFGDGGLNTLGLVRSLGEAGHMVELLLIGNADRKAPVEFSRYVSSVKKVSSASAGVAFLVDEAKSTQKGVVYCGSDSSISAVDASLERLRVAYTLFNIKDRQGQINHFINKNNTFKIAARNGLKVINTWEISNACDLPENITYPCLTKGNNSLFSKKSMILVCQNRGELRDVVAQNGFLLVQEYIKKDFELCIVGVSFSHGEYVYIPGAVKKIRETFTRQSDYIALFDIDTFEGCPKDEIRSFIKELGYEGLFSIELLCKDRVYYFLEVNLRNDGVGYLYTKAGINLPELWYRYSIGELDFNGVADINFQSPLYAMQIWDLVNVLTGKVSIFRWCADLLNTRACFVFNLLDMKPFWCSSWLLIERFLRKIISIAKKSCGIVA